LKFLFKNLVRNLIVEIHDSQIKRISECRRLIPSNLNVINVSHKAMNLVEHVPAIRQWALISVSKERVDIHEVRKTAARNVTGIPLKSPVLSLKVVKVRIVNDASGDLTRVPVERRVTIRTPHLRTSGNLVNHGSALDARLGVLFQKLHRLDGRRVALVVLALDFVTL
jgi:hypothetical protein